MTDAELVLRSRGGDEVATRRLVKRHWALVRLKASSYFLLGGESDDLIQEGLLGLYKAIRDYRTDRESSFRNFAELCITRQIITAVKTATRNKHTPLNQYVSFSQTPAAAGGDSNMTIGEILPAPSSWEPPSACEAAGRSAAILDALARANLSAVESESIFGIADGLDYERIAQRGGYDVKQVDNAAQRARRKIAIALEAA
ncbi:MAG TPA: sigma-70 family RNA polymerase sigma factor [Solirubrobacterales bacterium]|nr:sigma-70 family RNA polymerase sigma factor [Solirubrobacterales bacterium]